MKLQLTKRRKLYNSRAPLSPPAGVCSPQCTPALGQCPHLCAPHTAAPLCSPTLQHSSAPCRGCIVPVTRALAGHWTPAISRLGRSRSLHIEFIGLHLLGKRDIAKVQLFKCLKIKSLLISSVLMSDVWPWSTKFTSYRHYTFLLWLPTWDQTNPLENKQ